jgi:hypothetical protein
LRGKKAYFTLKGSRCIHDFPLWCATAGLFLIFFLLPHPGLSQEEPDYEEISVFLYIPEIGMVEEPAYIKGQVLYLSVSDIFTFLKIQNTPSPSYDSVTGYFINPQSLYTVNRTLNRIVYQNTIFGLQPGDLIRTDNNLYLRSDYFGKVFGLECIFDFRRLSVVMKTKLELPLIREMKQELMRRNIRRLKGEMKADTVIKRSYPFFHLGMADWTILATQQMSKRDDEVLSLMLGSILAGGETNITLNYNNNIPFTEKEQLYYWHFVNNDFTAFRQVTLGKVAAQATSTLHGPLLGAQVTNTPTQFRRSFSSYRLSDHTEPGWIVELYVNNVLVDYVKADASGFFTFEVPLVYGNSSVKLRYYGPWGEERTREQSISIPFNFLPPRKLEYSLSSGMVEDGRKSMFSRATFHYGTSKRLTVGWGIEYLSSVTSGPTMPFLDFSMRIASNVLISGDYTFGVKGKGILNWHMPSGITLQLNYTKFQKYQTAVINPYLEDRKLAVSVPVNSRIFASYLRFTLDQVVLEKTKYIYSEILISGSLFGVSTNLTTFGTLTDPVHPNVTSTLALGIRLPKRISFTPEVQYDFTNNQLISSKFGLEKSFYHHGIVNLTYEYNFWGSISTLQVGLRYDFPFAQSGLTANYSNGLMTFGQAARGSLMLDQKTHYLGVSNRANVGKCGIVILAFLDFNRNGRRDPGEPKVNGLNIHITGGRIEQSKHDSLIRVFDLQPFIHYFIEIDRSSFENVAWQIQKPTISVAVDANQFKLVEIPVSVHGEVSGMVYFNNDGSLTGQERITVYFFRDDSIQVAKTLSESDGYFSFLGLSPGSYTARIDSNQLIKLHMKSVPESIPFMIKQKLDGDQAGGLEFILHSLLTDTAVLRRKAVTNVVVSADELHSFPEKEIQKDSVKEKQKEGITENKKMTPDTTVLEPKIKPRETVQPVPAVLPQLTTEKFFVADSCDYALQTSIAYPLVSALVSQKKLADTLRRPVIIISEGGICKLRVTGFCGLREAESYIKKLADMGFPGTYVVHITGYSVQVGAFRVRAYALAIQAQLVASFARPILIVYEDGYYKVRITGFLRFGEAKKFVPQLIDQGFPDIYLLKSH